MFITEFPPLVRALRLLSAAGPGPSLIIGPCGAGKTALARWLGHKWGGATPARISADVIRGARDATSVAAAARRQAVIVEDGDLLALEVQAVFAAEAKRGALALLFTARSDAVNPSDFFTPELARACASRCLALPPLRQRRSDVRPLTEHLRAERLRIEPEALELLEQHAWPENVKELSAVLRAANLWVQLGRAPRLTRELAANLIDAAAAASIGLACRQWLNSWLRDGDVFDDLGFKGSTRFLEATLITRALHEAGGNMVAAARVLRLPHTTLKSRTTALSKEIALLRDWLT